MGTAGERPSACAGLLSASGGTKRSGTRRSSSARRITGSRRRRWPGSCSVATTTFRRSPYREAGSPPPPLAAAATPAHSAAAAAKPTARARRLTAQSRASGSSITAQAPASCRQEAKRPPCSAATSATTRRPCPRRGSWRLRRPRSPRRGQAANAIGAAATAPACTPSLTSSRRRPVRSCPSIKTGPRPCSSALAIRLSRARAIAAGSQATREPAARQRSSMRLPASAAGVRQRPTASLASSPASAIRRARDLAPPLTIRSSSPSASSASSSWPWRVLGGRRRPARRQREDLKRPAELVQGPVEPHPPPVGPQPAGDDDSKGQRQRPGQGRVVSDRVQHLPPARR